MLLLFSFLFPIIVLGNSILLTCYLVSLFFIFLFFLSFTGLLFRLLLSFLTLIPQPSSCTPPFLLFSFPLSVVYFPFFFSPPLLSSFSFLLFRILLLFLFTFPYFWFHFLSYPFLFRSSLLVFFQFASVLVFRIFLFICFAVSLFPFLFLFFVSFHLLCVLFPLFPFSLSIASLFCSFCFLFTFSLPFLLLLSPFILSLSLGLLLIPFLFFSVPFSFSYPFPLSHFIYSPYLPLTFLFNFSSLSLRFPSSPLHPWISDRDSLPSVEAMFTCLATSSWPLSTSRSRPASCVGGGVVAFVNNSVMTALSWAGPSVYGREMGGVVCFG